MQWICRTVDLCVRERLCKIVRTKLHRRINYGGSARRCSRAWMRAASSSRWRCIGRSVGDEATSRDAHPLSSVSPRRPAIGDLAPTSVLIASVADATHIGGATIEEHSVVSLVLAVIGHMAAGPA